MTGLGNDAAGPALGAPDAGPIAEAGQAAGEDDDAGSDATVAAGPMSHAARVSLLDHTAWTRAEATEDPFGDAPESLYCVEAATGAETLGGELTYSVETLDCNYVTVRQMTRDYVAAGETIEVRLAHFDLTAPSDSEAHLAVRLGELTLLDERVPIPSPSAVLQSEVVATQDIPAGTALYFHVHNHGENSYALVAVTTGP